MNIDYDRLKSDLMNYFGTATSMGFPQAMIELSEVELANPQKLIEIAIRSGIDLDDYKDKNYLGKKR